MWILDSALTALWFGILSICKKDQYFRLYNLIKSLQVMNKILEICISNLKKIYVNTLIIQVSIVIVRFFWTPSINYQFCRKAWTTQKNSIIKILIHKRIHYWKHYWKFGIIIGVIKIGVIFIRNYVFTLRNVVQVFHISLLINQCLSDIYRSSCFLNNVIFFWRRTQKSMK